MGKGEDLKRSQKAVGKLHLRLHGNEVITRIGKWWIYSATYDIFGHVSPYSTGYTRMLYGIQIYLHNLT